MSKIAVLKVKRLAAVLLDNNGHVLTRGTVAECEKWAKERGYIVI